MFLYLAGAFALAQPPEVRVGVTQRPPKLDGKINPQEWAGAGIITDLTQADPKPGQPHAFRTRVYLLADRDHLYIGFHCVDPEPGRIAVHTRARDGEFSGDDHVGIFLDTYGDRRTGYGFRVNAAGARQDALIAGATDELSTDWNGIWDAHTARHADGWSAEVVIPARTLNFRHDGGAWGLNFVRWIARERVRLTWSSPVLDAMAWDMSRAGTLTGVEGLQQGRGLELTPYLLGRAPVAFGQGRRAYQMAGGADFGWRITPQLSAVITGNTDFADTEADLRQVNTTRFPLFFPERRQFFLEGSNQFEFGLGLGQNFIPFFSRRVGLVDGQQVPIDVGARLLGRAGNWNVALLNVQTRAIANVAATNLTAGRVSYDVTPEFRVGGLFTHGDPAEASDRNDSLYGTDAVYRTSKFRGNKNLQVGAWVAQSGRSRGQSGWGASVEYPNDRWFGYARVSHFGDNLEPKMGFLPRAGVTRYEGAGFWQPRPRRGRWGRWVRQSYHGAESEFVVNTAGKLETLVIRPSLIDMEFQSGDSLTVSLSPRYEFLPVPFAIADGVVLAPGSYPFLRQFAGWESSRFRAVRVQASVERGSFYNGHLDQYLADVNWTDPHGRLQLSVSAEINSGRLNGDQAIVQRVWQTRNVWSLNANLSMVSLFQYDSVSRQLGGNTRLQWFQRPNVEWSAVWNRGWRQMLRTRDLTLAPDAETFVVKLRYTLRR